MSPICMGSKPNTMRRACSLSRLAHRGKEESQRVSAATGGVEPFKQQRLTRLQWEEPNPLTLYRFAEPPGIGRQDRKGRVMMRNGVLGFDTGCSSGRHIRFHPEVPPMFNKATSGV